MTLAQELAALGPALVPLIAADNRFLTLEWHCGGLSHPMLSGPDFWSISTGNVEIEVEPYVAAFPARAKIGARAQAAFDATGSPCAGILPTTSFTRHWPAGSRSWRRW